MAARTDALVAHIDRHWVVPEARHDRPDLEQTTITTRPSSPPDRAARVLPDRTTWRDLTKLPHHGTRSEHLLNECIPCVQQSVTFANGRSRPTPKSRSSSGVA